ncbi:MAG: heavy metal translocating P-type ATPase [Treponema sp.]
MKIYVHHALPGRLRLLYDKKDVSSQQALLAMALIAVQNGITSIDINHIRGSYLICYDTAVISDQAILRLFEALTEKYLQDPQLLENVAAIPQQESIVGTIIVHLIYHYVKKWFLPAPIRALLVMKNSLPRVGRSLHNIVSGRVFSTNLLDATALTVSLATGDTATASTIAMLLNLGDTLEEITKRKSYDNLAQSLLANDEQVQLVIGDEEKTVSSTTLKKGDLVIVRAGSPIPVDGTVESGNGMVNQASITGESLPVEKHAAHSVFAGTILVEGELLIRVRTVGKDTKVHNIITLVDQSQSLKANAQKRSEQFAEKIVPFNFLLAACTWLITGNTTKTIATLLVDYSCAMKLAAPIAVLSAMREAAALHISIKGGSYLEHAALAQTIIFDKTGTLTYAQPHVEAIHTFNSYTERDVLTLAACLEEHFPHPLGRAIVQAAAEKGYAHPEKHTKVEYIVAHGIMSSLGEQKLRIGSAHFIFDDEGIQKDAAVDVIQREAMGAGYSLLYFAIDAELAAVFAIGDPIRADAKTAIAQLKKTGMEKCIMITGDAEGAAKKIATEAGIDFWYAQALPEDKVKYVKAEHEAGHRVIMIGDGINDAPALAAAEVGVSIDGAAAIAGDVADINLSSKGLTDLVLVRELGQGLLKKMRMNDRFIIGFNSFLLIGSMAGLISPALAAILHNGSTLGISLVAMRSILKQDNHDT